MELILLSVLIVSMAYSLLFIKNGFYYNWILVSWAGVFVLVPVVYIVLGFEGPFLFILATEFMVPYALTVSLFFLLFPFVYTLSTPGNIKLPLSDIQMLDGKYILYRQLLLLLFLIWIFWVLSTKNFVLFEGISRSDVLMADQERQVREGAGAGMFLKSLEYIILGLIGYVFMYPQGKRFAVVIFSMYVFLQLMLIFASGLFRSPIFTYILLLMFSYGYVLYDNKRVMLGVVVVFLLFPFIMSFLAFYRAAQEVVNLEWSHVVVHGLSGFATVSEMSYIVNGLSSGLLKYEYGIQFLYDFITWIPRFLWEGKPVTSFSYRISEYIFGDIGVGGAWVHTFTPLGEGLLQFGFLGMIISVVLIMLVISAGNLLIGRYPQFRLAGLYYMLSFPISFRGDLNSVFGRFFEFVIAFVLFYLLIKFVAYHGAAHE